MVNRLAVVTGASSGLGQATALALAREGAAVYVHAYRNIEGLAQTADAIRAVNAPCRSSAGDLAEESAQEELMNTVWGWAQELGAEGVDVWVNLAGVDVLTGERAAWSFEQKLAQLFRVDVAATIRLSRLVGQRMRSRGGCIINVGWDQADWGMEGESGELFAAIKGSVMAFSRSLAKSLAPDVRVNCVAPGWIRTKWAGEASARWQARAVRESLLGRWGMPEDVAAAICFLSSDRAAFINGQTLNVNGGFSTTSEVQK